jgi:ATP-binding cassette subfamily B protein
MGTIAKQQNCEIVTACATTPLPDPISTTTPQASGRDGATLRRLLPYLWQYKWRVLAALLFMVGAKLANVGVPVLLKHLVDALTLKPATRGLLVVPVGLLLAYGLLRLSTSLFTELRELVFAKATQGAARSIALRPSSICMPEPALSPGAPDRRHDARHRARRAGIESLISYSLYSICPR